MKKERFTPKNWVRPKIEHNKLTQWNWMVSYPDKLELGEYVDIGAFTYIAAHYGVLIEDYVQIGGGCQIITNDTIDDLSGKIVIRKKACIGANSVILPNTEIGEEAVIGALSFVSAGTKIPSNEIWAGVPAKKLRGFEEKQPDKFLEQWKRKIGGKDISKEELKKAERDIIGKFK